MESGSEGDETYFLNRSDGNYGSSLTPITLFWNKNYYSFKNPIKLGPIIGRNPQNSSRKQLVYQLKKKDQFVLERYSLLWRADMPSERFLRVL